MRASPLLAFALSFACLPIGAGCTTRASLGEQCSLNSQCAGELVCRLGRCRNECAADEDCNLGLYCAVNNRGLGSCLLPDEAGCDSDRSCPESLRCADDAVCRSACVSERACLRSQTCFAGYCVDAEGELRDAGPPGDGGADAGCAAETCNGRDDDCDGDTDESCVVGPGLAGTCDPSGACVTTGCADGFADCDGDLTDGCEELASDRLHCGECDNSCPGGFGAIGECEAGACVVRCDPSRSMRDCNDDLDPVEGDGCETDIARDPLHCGGCGTECGDGLPCIDRVCSEPAFPSDGRDGAFEPTEDAVLGAGIHRFSTFTVPDGVTVTTTGSGILEIYAMGELRVDGTIDLSGGRGGDSFIGGRTTSGGGATGNPLDSPETVSGECARPAPGGAGSAGGDPPAAPVDCARGGRNGGGSGGMPGAIESGGGGGGGYSGGGGGGGRLAAGGAGASHGGSVGGAAGEMCAPGGGGEGPDGFAGRDGLRNTERCIGAGGGGGSIGAAAIGDRAVASTFYPGSGGGGGGAAYLPPGFAGTGGAGGGGGGALRLASATRIVIGPAGRVLADGGAGGDLRDNHPAAAGGGGSGGVIFLSAPALVMNGTVSVAGGDRGEGVFDGVPHDGGDGGHGRIRVSVDEGRCESGGQWRPGMGFTCAPNTEPAPNEVYVGSYPD